MIAKMVTMATIQALISIHQTCKDHKGLGEVQDREGLCLGRLSISRIFESCCVVSFRYVWLVECEI